MGTMFLLWLTRPLATAFVAWLSIADRKAYRDTAREVAIVDSLYGCVNVYLFSAVAKITNTKRPLDVPAPARLARAGSALWLLAFVLSILLLCVYFSEENNNRESLNWRPPNDNGKGSATFAHALPVLWFVTDCIRFLACWLLWAGLLFTDDTAFCPSQRALAGITVIWLFVPFLDCVWRGVATYKKVEGIEVQALMDT
jgi:hypothetical protein